MKPLLAEDHFVHLRSSHFRGVPNPPSYVGEDGRTGEGSRFSRLCESDPSYPHKRLTSKWETGVSGSPPSGPTDLSRPLSISETEPDAVSTFGERVHPRRVRSHLVYVCRSRKSNFGLKDTTLCRRRPPLSLHRLRKN